jgi:hypothetical protein
MKALPKTLCLAGLLTLWTGVIGCDTTGASDPVKVFQSASDTVRTSEFDAAEKLPKLRNKHMRARMVRLQDVDRLRRGEPVVFNLFPDVNLVAEDVKVVPDEKGPGFYWSAHIKGTKTGSIMMNVRYASGSPRLRGVFRGVEEGVYFIEAKGENIHTVTLTDRSNIGSSKQKRPNKPPNSPLLKSKRSPDGNRRSRLDMNQESLEATNSSSATEIIDVLALYTDEAKATLGSYNEFIDYCPVLKRKTKKRSEARSIPAA